MNVWHRNIHLQEKLIDLCLEIFNIFMSYGKILLGPSSKHILVEWTPTQRPEHGQVILFSDVYLELEYAATLTQTLHSKYCDITELNIIYLHVMLPLTF